jgi:hypothetical protein
MVDPVFSKRMERAISVPVPERAGWVFFRFASPVVLQGLAIGLPDAHP